MKAIFKKSLKASEKLLDSLSKEQLEELMVVFDNYEIEQLHIHGVSKSYCEHNHISWEGKPLKIICQNCGREVDKKDVC